ncbi:acetyltransferase [Nitrospira sp. NS4]|uniref:acetyltransferase n=1 Tax=Nitrospira sp. NS4 TaxID=3414498 RepID=UPI003C2CDABF
MDKPAIIFGTGSLAEVVDFYLTHDSPYRVVAFTATGESVKESNYLGRPVVAFEDVAKEFPAGSHEMFVAIGYRKLNQLREQYCAEARARGYRLLSYLCSKTTHWGETQLGDNTFVFEDNTLQPFVQIGSGTILWSGNHIGHHTSIGANCFITSHVVISGHCRVGDRCFVGVNATIADSISIGDDNIIGPGVLIQKDTAAGEVYVAERTKKFPKDSSRFFR